MFQRAENDSALFCAELGAKRFLHAMDCTAARSQCARALLAYYNRCVRTGVWGSRRRVRQSTVLMGEQ